MGKENENMQIKEILNFETFEVIDGIIYTQIIDKNMLFRIGSNESNPELLDKSIHYRFKHCINLENKLYFADNLGKALLEYDVRSNLYQIYEIDCCIKDDNNIACVVQGDGRVFVISQYKGTIFVLDTANKRIEREEIVEKRIKDLYGESTDVIIRAWGIGEYIYMFINAADKCYICKYNMKKRELEEISEKVFPYNMRCAYCFRQKLYILKDDVTLCIWNTANNKTQTIEMAALESLLKGEKLKYAYAFSALAVTQKNIWLFPAGENDDIYIFDLLGNSAYVYNEYPSDFFYLDKKRSKYTDIKERGGQIYVAARLSNYYLTIDVGTGHGIWKPTGTYDFTEYYQERFWDLIGEKDNEWKVAYEESRPIFQIFLQYQRQLTNYSNEDKTVGQKIWETL